MTSRIEEKPHSLRPQGEAAVGGAKIIWPRQNLKSLKRD